MRVHAVLMIKSSFIAYDPLKLYPAFNLHSFNAMQSPGLINLSTPTKQPITQYHAHQQYNALTQNLPYPNPNFHSTPILNQHLNSPLHSAHNSSQSSLHQPPNKQLQHQHLPTPDSEPQNHKTQSVGQKQTQRKKRRKKVDADGRDYTCSCGKSYLSYPALYTHVKTKHNGQISITQNLRIHLAPSNPMAESRQNLHQSKKQAPPQRHQPDEDSHSIQKIKQLIYKQFIKDRPKESLIQFKDSLQIREDQRLYVNQIIKMAQYSDCVKQQENRDYGMLQRSLESSNSKSEHGQMEGHSSMGKEESEVFGIQGSPEMRRFERINVIRSAMVERAVKDTSRQVKSERKSMVSCVFAPIPQVCKKSSMHEDSSIDEVLGSFLSEFLRGVGSNELINTSVVYFICKVKQYFTTSEKRFATSEQPGESLMQESGKLVGYLTEMQNPYLRQPIMVCKMLFFLYRWMFRQQFTCKFVRFNQVV